MTLRHAIATGISAATLALSLALAAPALAQQGPVEGWGLEATDVVPDPAITYGTLENGMQYAIRANDTPDGAASFRLHFDFGSMGEADDEQGLAHFIEHMAFNGSTNVPEGEMIPLLERLGLAFGPDTNAYTSFEETVYMLDVPNANAEGLDTALFLLRETAGELTFAPEAVDREREILVSERRVRDLRGCAISAICSPSGCPGRCMKHASPSGWTRCCAKPRRNGCAASMIASIGRKMPR